MTGQLSHEEATVHFWPDASPAQFTARMSLHDALSIGWVHGTGELDIAHAEACYRALRRVERDAYLVVLDLQRLKFMDSAGVAVICGAARRLGVRQRELIIVVSSGSQVHRLLHLLGLTHWLNVVDDAVTAATFELDLHADHARGSTETDKLRNAHAIEAA